MRSGNEKSSRNFVLLLDRTQLCNVDNSNKVLSNVVTRIKFAVSKVKGIF